MATWYQPPDPNSVEKGQLYFLELREFPDCPKIVVRVDRVFHKMGVPIRAEIEFIGGDHTLTIIFIDRLLVEHLGASR